MHTGQPGTLDTQAAGDGDSSQEPRVLLFMRPDRDRELLVETLGEQYRVETTTDVETLDTEFDCCVFDSFEFNRVGGTLQSRRDTSEPVFLPFVLLVGDGGDESSAKVWDYVDDVIEMPVKKAELLARIRNLVERRRTAVELETREQQLKRTVDDLKLKERAMDEAPVGISITEADGERDNPMIYVNEQFERITGYDSSVLGEDCRFLQGPETDPENVASIREAIDAEERVSVDILNYQENGRSFWNKLDIAPIHDEGEASQYVGFQTDITERKIKERRLEVLNRVLNHNLRNRMNVIEGYLTLLRDEYGDADPPDAVEQIETAAADLMGLADSVQRIERTLDSPDHKKATALDERLAQLVSAFEDRYPSTTFRLSVPEDDPCSVRVVGLVTAVEEAVENAVVHNDDPDPVVEIRVQRSSPEWIDIEIVDNGPGIPEQELDVLNQGETSLQHANRLGIWLMYWVISKAGGEFSATDRTPTGTTVRFTVPSADC